MTACGGNSCIATSTRRHAHRLLARLAKAPIDHGGASVTAYNIWRRAPDTDASTAECIGTVIGRDIDSGKDRDVLDWKDAMRGNATDTFERLLGVGLSLSLCRPAIACQCVGVFACLVPAQRLQAWQSGPFARALPQDTDVKEGQQYTYQVSAVHLPDPDMMRSKSQATPPRARFSACVPTDRMVEYV